MTAAFIVILIITLAVMAWHYDQLDKQIDDLLEIIDMKKDFDKMVFESITDLKERVSEADEIARNARIRTRELEKKLERGVIYEEKR